MFRKKIFPALMAFSITGSTAFIAPVTATEKATTQTMADQYDPHFPPAEGRGDVISLAIQPRISDILHALPRETKFTLLGTGLGGFIDAPGAAIFLNAGGRINIHTDRENADPAGARGSFDVLVVYPDDSSEIITTEYHVYSAYSASADPKYQPTSLEIGETAVITRSGSGFYPEGTTFRVISSPAVDDLRSRGWEFSVNSEDGTATITAPGIADERAQIPVIANYPDGSFDQFTLNITTVEPEADLPEEPELPDEKVKPTPAPRGSSFGSS